MPEKTGGAKRHSPIPDTLDCFLERLTDEPEHAPDLAQEIAHGAADFLQGDHRPRDQNFFGRVLFLLSHFQVAKCPSSANRKAISSRWRALKRGLLVRSAKIYGRTMFSNLRTGRGR